MSARNKTRWMPWHDELLNMHMQGYSVPEMSSILKKHANTIKYAMNAGEFISRATALKAKDDDGLKAIIDGVALLQDKKTSLISQVIKIALNGERENTRLQASMWLLERFPEFANKAQMTQQTTIYTMSVEERQRMEDTADKMTQFMKTMANGDNPYVITPLDPDIDAQAQLNHGIQFEPEAPSVSDITTEDAGTPGPDSATP